MGHPTRQPDNTEVIRARERAAARGVGGPQAAATTGNLVGDVQQEISSVPLGERTLSSDLLRLLTAEQLQQLEEEGLPDELFGLARGELGAPTEQQQQLVQQSIGAAGDIARRELEASLPGLFAQASGGAAARGISGSSQEAFSRAHIGGQAVRSLENLFSREQAAGGQALLQLPFQQAQTQLNAQQLLFNQLVGATLPLRQIQGQEQLGRRQIAAQQDQGSILDSLLGAAGTAVGGAVGGPVGAAIGGRIAGGR